MRRVIDSLGDLGVLLSLDDFGTGYSPLSYLRELPVTEIKIDRSFVAAMMSDRDTATIVAAVIGLARRLGIEVVAEGIETAGQLEMLRGFECPFAQGYLFSRPLPAQVRRALAEGGRARAHRRRGARGGPARRPRRRAAGARAGSSARPTAGALVWPGPARRAARRPDRASAPRAGPRASVRRAARLRRGASAGGRRGCVRRSASRPSPASWPGAAAGRRARADPSSRCRCRR